MAEKPKIDRCPELREDLERGAVNEQSFCMPENTRSATGLVWFSQALKTGATRLPLPIL
jgi:hypothetical protein